MKTAVVLCDDIKQVILTPENKIEREALKLFTPGENIELAIKNGSFYGSDPLLRCNIGMCMGGYLRAFNDIESVILVLTPRKEKGNAATDSCGIQGC